MRIFKAMLAAIVIVAFSVGVPLGLTAWIGNPIHGFTEGLVTDTTILDALALVAWLFWAQMVAAFAIETINQIGELRGADYHLPVPAIGAQHNLVRALVGAVLTVGVLGASVTAGAAKADAATLATPQQAATISHVTHTSTPATQQAPTADQHQMVVTVHHGDTLWDLAQTHLGDGTKWRDIVAANQGRDLGGVVATAAVLRSDLQPGWQLIIPTPAPVAHHGETSHVVQAGENLSEIAQHELGNGNDWPQVYAANRAEIGDNPSLIQPGEHLLIPGTHDASTPIAPNETGHVTPETPQSHTDRPATGKHTAPASPQQHTAPKPAVVAPPSASVLPTHVAPHVTSPRVSVPKRAPVAPVTPATPATPSNVEQSNAPTQQGYSNAVPTPGEAAQIKQNQAEHQQVEAADAPTLMQALAPWIVGGLVGSGTMLAGVLYLRLRDRRRDRFRARRPGRALAAPEPALAPVEMTVNASGGLVAAAVETVDLELRRLGYFLAQSGRELPSIAAIEVTDAQILAHLTDPAELPAPWVQVTDDNLRWCTEIREDAAEIEGWTRPAPYPLLATVGQSEDGHWWLLNCEQLGAITVAGDASQARDLVRSIAAELTVARWATDARLDLIGVGEELVDMDRYRVHYREGSGIGPAISNAVSEALAMIDRSAEADSDAATGRATQPDDEVWGARLVLVDATEEKAADVDGLIDLIRDHPGRTATAVINAAAEPNAFTLTLLEDGSLQVNAVGLTLTPVELTVAEAKAITALYVQAADTNDVPIPVKQNAQGWEELVDVAGNIREEHTISRSTPTVGVETSTLLEGDDSDYTSTAAVTVEDLEVLSPRVPAAVAEAVVDKDPHLAEDMDEWMNHTRRQPRLYLLGKVKLAAYGEVAKKDYDAMGFYTELLAFLWTKRDQGATTQELFEAFPSYQDSIRPRLLSLRNWLGNNPLTGEPILPDARKAPAKKYHGNNVYQVDCGPGGLLVDEDLLRRKNAAAQAAGGEAGIDHLRQALAELVTGRPFADLRKGGWSWLLETHGQRLDEMAIPAVTDMVLKVSAHYLATGEIGLARSMAEIGVRAAPDSDAMTMNMVSVKAAEGNREDAMDLLDTQLLNRSDDGNAPLDLSPRTRRILEEHGWGEAV